MQVKSTVHAIGAALLVLVAAGCAQTAPPTSTSTSTACATPAQCDLYSGD